MKKIKNALEVYMALSKPVKATFWFTVCSFIQKGIVFLTTPIFTRLLTSEEYGIYTLYVTWTSIFSLLATLNLFASGFSNAMLKFEEYRDDYTTAMVGLTFVVTGVCAVIYFGFARSIDAFAVLPDKLMVLMFADVFFVGIFSLWAQQRRFEFDYRRLIVITLLVSFFSPLLGIALIKCTEDHLTARIASNTLVCGIIYGTVLVWIVKKSKRLYDKKYWKYALGFALPLIPHYLSQMILNQADRIMIDEINGAQYAAYYGVAYNVAYILQILITSVNTSFGPWMYQSIKDKKITDIQNITYKLAVMFAILVLIPVLVGPELIMILATEEYYVAKWVVPPVALSVYFCFLYNMFSCVEFYYEKKFFVMTGSVVIAVINIALNAIFLPIYGFAAAGYTTLVCYILYSIAHYGLMTVALKQNGMPQKLFKDKKILLISVLCTAVGLAFNILYDGWIARYILLGIIISGLFMKRRQIIALIKR